MRCWQLPHGKQPHGPCGDPPASREAGRAHQGPPQPAKAFFASSRIRGFLLPLVLPGFWPNSLGTTNAKETALPSHFLPCTPEFLSAGPHHPGSDPLPHPSLTSCRPISLLRRRNPIPDSQSHISQDPGAPAPPQTPERVSDAALVTGSSGNRVGAGCWGGVGGARATSFPLGAPVRPVLPQLQELEQPGPRPGP